MTSTSNATITTSTPASKTMLRILAIALAMMASPAWAGCSNYIDGSLKTKPPRALLCIAEACEETTLSVECGNIHGAGFSYANGFSVTWDPERGTSAVMNGTDIDFRQVKCTAIDEGGCFSTN